MGPAGGLLKDTVCLVDFGAAKRYLKHDGQHIPEQQNVEVKTSPCYLSINAHLGICRTRRDDLISLGYIFVHLLKGRLPWQKLRREQTLEKKMTTPIEVLCQGLPGEFALYLKYCCNLKFAEVPDYLFLDQLFRALCEREKYDTGETFDWPSVEDWNLISKPTITEAEHNLRDISKWIRSTTLSHECGSLPEALQPSQVMMQGDATSSASTTPSIETVIAPDDLPNIPQPDDNGELRHVLDSETSA